MESQVSTLFLIVVTLDLIVVALDLIVVTLGLIVVTFRAGLLHDEDGNEELDQAVSNSFIYQSEMKLFFGSIENERFCP